VPFFGAEAELVAASLPAGDLVMTEGADHVPHWSMVDRYIGLVTEFAAGVPAA
jgi:hypothetical protein